MRWLERGLVVIVSIAIAIGIIVLLSGGLAGSHDDPGISPGSGSVPGTAYRDQGAAHLPRGHGSQSYDSDPPTSGPHAPVPVTGNDARISDDQLLEALEQGNVVLLYSGRRPPRGLQAIADGAAPSFTPELARAGQAVILGRRPGLTRITAVAWAHLLRSDDAGQLSAFTRHWLGHGAPQASGTITGSS